MRAIAAVELGEDLCAVSEVDLQARGVSKT